MAFFDLEESISHASLHASTQTYPKNRVWALSLSDVKAVSGPTYRMRGFDQNGAVNDYVFWDSYNIDSGAADYAGSAGPVVDIIVHKVIGG